MRKLLNHPFLHVFISFLGGTFASFAMAPFNLWLALIPGLSVLYIVTVKARSLLSTFLSAYAFGFGYFLLGLSWVGNALLVEGNPYAWAWPLAVCGLPLLLSAFYGLAAICSRFFCKLDTITGYIGFTAWFALFEWLRGHVFTGFPWNLWGYSWIDILPITQITAFSDIYLLTWLTAFWLCLPGFLLISIKNKQQCAIMLLLTAMSFAAIYGFGSWRLSTQEITYKDMLVIKIIQPNIPQHEKWDRTKMTGNFFKTVRLSYPEPEQADPGKVTYIIWPETAVSYHFIQDESSLNIIRQMLQSYPGETYLLTGYLDYNREKQEYGNAFIMLSENGEIIHHYRKHHLVPFGEYIPFQEWIPLRPVAEFSGFNPGPGPQSYVTEENLSFVPLICYEAIFPHKVLQSEKSADILINVTNDAWYGRSAGPYQHLTISAFRAIESGKPLIRSANTGISAVVDPLGRTIEKSELMTDEVIISTLPLLTDRKNESPYTRFISILVFTAIIILAFFRKKKLNYQ